MLKMHRTGKRRRALAGALALAASFALASGVADAHFRLIAPANWMIQSTDGTPQKTGPCGNEAPQTPSNVVTPFRPGDTITIQLEETTFHPGHYRVALAVNSPSELPPEPTVTAGSSACGSVPIQQPPIFPVLADGMLQHTQALSGTQSFQVKLPTDVTCTACTLQIIEFMSAHTAPCFYHHCAKISIQSDGGSGPSDSGSDAARDGASGGGAGSGGTGGTAGASGASGGGGVGGTGTGGTGTGGSTGTGGTTGTGGSTGTGGTTGTGGSTGAGGTTGTGGSTGAGGTTGTGGSTGTGSNDPVQQTSGCSCSTPGRERRSATVASVLLAFAFVSARRRHRR